MCHVLAQSEATENEEEEEVRATEVTYLIVEEVPPLLWRKHPETHVTLCNLALNRRSKCQTTSQLTYQTSQTKELQTKRLRNKRRHCSWLRLTWGSSWTRRTKSARKLSTWLLSQATVKVLTVRGISLKIQQTIVFQLYKTQEMRSLFKNITKKYLRKSFRSWSNSGISESFRIFLRCIREIFKN